MVSCVAGWRAQALAACPGAGTDAGTLRLTVCAVCEQKRAMEKEAMAMAVVDGQAVKAIMEEADRHNFELHPSADACPLDAVIASAEDRASLEATLAAARSAGCDIATIQLWKQLLAEDKDMKINSSSRRKVRLRSLPTSPQGTVREAVWSQRVLCRPVA